MSRNSLIGVSVHGHLRTGGGMAEPECVTAQRAFDIKLSLQDTPPGSASFYDTSRCRMMAGLLTCGSPLSRTFPGWPTGLSQWSCRGRSPLTVAGAVTDLAKAAPCSHFIQPTQRRREPSLAGKRASPCRSSAKTPLCCTAANHRLTVTVQLTPLYRKADDTGVPWKALRTIFKSCAEHR